MFISLACHRIFDAVPKVEEIKGKGKKQIKYNTQKKEETIISRFDHKTSVANDFEQMKEINEQKLFRLKYCL